MKIDLRIDRLVLDAALLNGGRADAVAAAIESALTRQLAMPGVAEALRAIGHVDALPVRALVTDTSARPRNLGADIAASLGDALGIAAQGAHGDRAMRGDVALHRTDDPAPRPGIGQGRGHRGSPA